MKMWFKVPLLLVIINFSFLQCEEHKIQTRALQQAHEKLQIDRWSDAFLGNTAFDQITSLVNLLNMIMNTYLQDCTPIILYDTKVERSDELILQQLFYTAPYPFVHGQISDEYKVKSANLLSLVDNKCVSYVLFVADVMRCKDIIGEQNDNRVVVVSRSSQWRVNEFLSGEASQYFVNLLIISQSDSPTRTGKEIPYILYTHKLFVDGIGSSAPVVLTSWQNKSLTRPYVKLFPEKMREGFSGHRFIISLALQPPFVIARGVDENDDVKWDGLEVRLVKLLGEKFNFTTDFRNVKVGKSYSAVHAVIENVKKKKANIGLSGIYVTIDGLTEVDVSTSHSYDCASFISLTSTALPRYRAIMGPFHWSVWLALTMAYLLIILPLAFSDKLTLKHLLKNPEEIENMFWYVFGTFTNSFTFGDRSWTNSSRITTRILIGFYWLFTIITTACYTGSIIAFITLPIYPATVDTVQQLERGHYQIGTLGLFGMILNCSLDFVNLYVKDSGGWEYWFQNSTDPTTIKLLKYMEFLPNVESGLKNVTKAFFWPYAFLASRAQLDYIVRTNFTTNNKRSLLHISSECFVPYGVGITFPKNSLYKDILNKGILRITQSGFMLKFKYDIEWEIMRSATGKLLQANSGTSLKYLIVEDRALTLDDTQGMFLLLGAGFLMGAASLLSEWLGGCFNCCKRKRAKSSSISLRSNPRIHSAPTPREKLDSIQFSLNEGRLESILDAEDNDDVRNHVHENKFNNSDDLDKEIDKIFNFDELFGEENHDDDGIVKEVVNEKVLSRTCYP